MKLRHVIRDSIVYAVSVGGIVRLRAHMRRQKSPLVRVLVFHDVRSGDWFEEVMGMLKEHYNVVTPDEFHNCQFRTDRINILLTFDDGYRSWITRVLPALETYGFKGLFFINSGLLDVAHDRELSASFMKEELRIKPKKPLTWKGARVLAKRGHTIGGHTARHAYLANYSKEECFVIVEEDKNKIESKLGITLQDFAYPFGTKASIPHYGPDAVRKAQYVYGYSAVSDFVQSVTDDRYMIPRMCVLKKQSLSSLRQWIEGGYDIFSRLKGVFT